MIKLNVQFEQPAKPFGAQAVQAVVSALDKALEPADIIINVRVCGSGEVRQLNKKYGGKDEATDVLSFNYQEGVKTSDERTGDVVVSYDHVKDQAKAAGTDEATELALLVLHGSLHVLGYDHQNLAEQTRVDKLQGDIMKKAGLSYRNFGWAR